MPDQDSTAQPDVSLAAGYVPIVLDRPPNPAMTLETWLPFKANALALSLANRLAEQPIDAASFCPLVLHAPPGMGKTHLLNAVAAVTPRARLIHIADWRVELERAARLGAQAELRCWLHQTDLLLIDDIDLCPDDAEVQRELLALVDDFCLRGKALVASSRVHPTLLKTLSAPLRSRLASGVLCELKMGDAEERTTLLGRLFGARPVSPEVLAHLAERTGESVRQLQGVVRQALAVHECLGAPIDLELARAILEPAATPEQPPDSEGNNGTEDGSRERLRQMLASAGNEGEQALALEIALSERLRQLRERGRSSPSIGRLEKALDLLRQGKTAEALKCISL